MLPLLLFAYVHCSQGPVQERVLGTTDPDTIFVVLGVITIPPGLFFGNPSVIIILKIIPSALPPHFQFRMKRRNQEEECCDFPSYI
ncbi:hypothetical protein BT67DRAFT_10281 [Trichocladium antarcticum]|uniref:Uncharacterized protein n=1 Tax=Trichocladium antarcticum TaxID=1450529 RepID=A0AAN6USL1_9PEZI|nr:hypothetical protein BT67DRAFT_10281 [Trichocladium antarcticum]